MRRVLSAVVISAVVGAGAVVSAQANIITGAVTGGDALLLGGTFVRLTVPFTESDPPNTVGQDNFRTVNLYGFDEEQNAEAIENVNYNFGPGGSAGFIPVGTIVASHYVFFDPAPGPTRSLTGFVDFDSPILGVATSRLFLEQSDDRYGNMEVDYLSPDLRGLESPPDLVEIDDGSVSGGRLTVDLVASAPGDFIRVFTQPSAATVPDGGWLAMLMSMALAGLGWLRCRLG